jgi:thymidylate synthase
MTAVLGVGPTVRVFGAGGEIDQVDQVVRRLRDDPNTKRAVISIFDPGRDFAETKDVPCNNWLQFIHRNGRLDLHVAVRANDAIWGFSGINFFEWSVLQEIVARSLGWRVGTMSRYVGTFHVYERHYSVADRLRGLGEAQSPYELGILATEIASSIDSLDGTLSTVFEAEARSREGAFEEAEAAEQGIADPFFRNVAIMLRLYNGHLQREPWPIIERALSCLGDSDFFTSAYEFLSRKRPDGCPFTVASAPQRAFASYYRGMRRLLPPLVGV